MTLLLDRPLDEPFDAGAPVSAAPTPGSPVASPLAALRYKWSMLAIAAVIIVATVPAIWLTHTPRYIASTIIEVLPTIQVIIERTDENGEIELYKDYLRTQVNLARSAVVLQEALENQRYGVQETSWYKETAQSDISPISRLLRTDMNVSHIAGTFLLKIAVATSVPQDGKIIADAIADAYISIKDNYNKESLKDRLKTLEDTSKYILDFRNAAQLNVDDIRREYPINPRRLFDNVAMELGVIKQKVLELDTEISGDVALLEKAKKATSQPAETKPAEYPDAESEPDLNPEWRFSQDSTWLTLNSKVEQDELIVTRLERKLGEENPKLIQAKEDLEISIKQRALREAMIVADNSDSMLQGGPDISINGQTLGALMNPIAVAEKELTRNRGMIVDLKKKEEKLEIRHLELMGAVSRLDDAEKTLARHQTRYEGVERRIEAYTIESKAIGNISLKSKAKVPDIPEKDRRLLLTAASIAAALMVSFTIAYLRVMVDPSVRNIGEVQALVPSPFLGVLPNISSESIADVAHGEFAEPIRIVRTALLERLKADGDRVLLITSASSGEGKTTLAVHLGHSLARLGQRVLVMDADFRKADLASRLDIDGTVGLRQVLEGSVDAADAIQATPMGGVDILPAGSMNGDNPREMLANGIFAAHLEQFKQMYDTVIIDGPPVLAAADAQIVAGRVNGVLLTVRAAKCKRDQARAACEQLQMVGGRVIGVVLNGVQDKAGTYNYGYGYGYGNRNGNDNGHGQPVSTPRLTAESIDTL
jgi:capsular exopolysaccharide synthesis family protein